MRKQIGWLVRRRPLLSRLGKSTKGSERKGLRCGDYSSPENPIPHPADRLAALSVSRRLARGTIVSALGSLFHPNLEKPLRPLAENYYAGTKHFTRCPLTLRSGEKEEQRPMAR
jgi:hypothetical protein